MKIRSGFVSNSSSASFVIKWRLNGRGDGRRSAKKAIQKLTEWCDDKDFANRITEKTVKYGNVYETDFWTSMLNNYYDFGHDAAMFYFILSMNCKEGDVEIISAISKNDY